MAIDYVGDLEGISEKQLNFITSVLQKQGYETGKATIASLGKDGGNYMAYVKRICIENSGRTLKMIIKIAPQDEMARLYSHTDIIFKNENIMYTQVLPKFVQLQKNADVPENDWLKYPQCYGCLLEPLNEVIILEDLDVLKFKTLDRLQQLSDQSIKSVLKNFATLHSLSYALKKLEPGTYTEFKNNLTDVWPLIMQIPDTEKYYQQIEDDAISLLDDINHKRLVKNTVSQVAAISEKTTKTDANNKHAVIQQGDSWTANIMFRIEDNKPIESILIDYQISKEGNPVFDLLYMIFNCTDHELRSKHFYEWIDYYHDEMDKSLSHFGLKANLVYPKDQLDVDLKRYGKLIFVLSVILTSLFISKSKSADNLKKSMETADMDLMTESVKLSALDEDTLALFKKKFEGLLKSFVEFGLL